MRKSILSLSVASLPILAMAQNAIEAGYLTQPDLKGTARFMSMGGAFGALGGDLSTLSQNPAGIGVYRNNEIGFTVDLDCQSSSALAQGVKNTENSTKFLLNNAGAVFTLKLPSSSVPNLNFGFTYNKTASFNRKYSGYIPQLSNSLSNFIAGVTTAGGWAEADIYDPDFNLYGDSKAGPWLSILGYEAFLFNMEPNPNGTADPYYLGQWEDGHTSGYGAMEVVESGGIDSYNIALGGNISNVVFWGMDFDITHINYNLTPVWEENLTNAYVESNAAGGVVPMPANWALSNAYNCTGDGFNFKLGLIVKPIQELRIGFAFHTPTWYNLKETYSGAIDYRYNNGANRGDAGTVYTNQGIPGYDQVNLRTPWRFIASIAGVIGGRFIISADYEWAGYNSMRYSLPSYNDYNWGNDYWYDPYDPYDPYYPWYAKGKGTKSRVPSYVSQDPYATQNTAIRNTFRASNTLRVGAEFRVTDRFSVRAGYSFVSSPIKDEASYRPMVMSGTIPSYRLDNDINYITCGLGYKISHFYADLAYVYKTQKSTFYAYSSYPQFNIDSQKANLTFNNSQVVLSAGFKF